MIGTMGNYASYGAGWMTSTSTGTTAPRRSYVPYQPSRTATAMPAQAPSQPAQPYAPPPSPTPSAQPTYAPSGTVAPPVYTPPTYVDSSGSMWGIGSDAVNQLFESIPIGGGWPFAPAAVPADKTKQPREPQGPSTATKLLTVAVIGAAGYGVYRLWKR